MSPLGFLRSKGAKDIRICSNGVAEGRNNKFKIVKCTMYDRCSRRLLEIKLMYHLNV